MKQRQYFDFRVYNIHMSCQIISNDIKCYFELDK